MLFFRGLIIALSFTFAAAFAVLAYIPPFSERGACFLLAGLLLAGFGVWVAREHF